MVMACALDYDVRRALHSGVVLSKALIMSANIKQIQIDKAFNRMPNEYSSKL